MTPTFSSKIVLIGPTCSGKTVMAERISRLYGHHRVVSFTTRPRRSNEIDGVDYDFYETTDDLDSAHIVEMSTFGGYVYGTTIDEYQHPKWVSIMDPYTASHIRRTSPRVFRHAQVALVTADEETLRQRYIDRSAISVDIGFDDRLERDKKALSAFFLKHIPDMVIDTTYYERTTRDGLPVILAQEPEYRGALSARGSHGSRDCRHSYVDLPYYEVGYSDVDDKEV